MKILKKLDSYILKKFQSFTDWLEHSIGVSCFSFAKICLGLAMCSFINGVLYDKKLNHDGLFMLAFGIIMFAISYAIWRMIANAQKTTRANPVYKNKLEEKLYSERIVVIAMLLFSLSIITILFALKNSVKGEEVNEYYSSMKFLILLAFASFFLVCTLYSMSCTPKPPRVSKLRKIVDGIRNLLHQNNSLIPG